MNLNELRDEVFKIACNHGFHDTELSDEHYLMLVITELSKAVEAVEADRKANIHRFKEWLIDIFRSPEQIRIERFKKSFESHIKDTIEDELADATIRLLDLAGLRKVDVEILDEEYKSLINDLKPDAKNQYSFSELMFNICESVINKNRYDDIKDVILTSIALIKIACHIYDINLEWHIEMKMKYNYLRENKYDKNISLCSHNQLLSGKIHRN